MELMFDEAGEAHLVLNYRCRECGVTVTVQESREQEFKDKNPQCPKCRAKDCWELIEEDGE